VSLTVLCSLFRSVGVEEFLESGIGAQGSKVWAGVDGGEIPAAEFESFLHLGQSLFFVALPGIGSGQKVGVDRLFGSPSFSKRAMAES